MTDLWEILDRAANIKEIIGGAGLLIILAYKNRDKFKQIAAKTAVKLKVKKPPDVVVHLQPANLQARAVELSGVIRGGSSMRADLQVGRQSLPAWEKLLWWYLRALTS